MKSPSWRSWPTSAAIAALVLAGLTVPASAQATPSLSPPPAAPAAVPAAAPDAKPEVAGDRVLPQGSVTPRRIPTARPVATSTVPVAFGAPKPAGQAPKGLAKVDTTGASLNLAQREARTASATLPGRVAVVGATWTSVTRGDVAVQIRTQRDGQWSPWEVLETDPNQDMSPGRGREGTEPYAVIDAERVEAVALTSTGATVPGLKLTVIDPGTSAADTKADRRADGSLLSAGGGATVSGIPASGPAAAPAQSGPALAAAAATNSNPLIYSRADWGADERIMTWTPATGRVQSTVIHHTAGSNSYAYADVPAVLRAIYRFHAIERDWGDIGYNVLVDRYGRAWEGRAGGLNRAVIGAHAHEHNRVSFGISVMGTFDVNQVPEAAFDTVARVVAWKFRLHGATPFGTTTVRVWNSSLNNWNFVPMKRVSGHMDVDPTGCPGKLFYARLPELEKRISGYLGNSNDRVSRHDLDGWGEADLLMVQGSKVTVGRVDPAGTKRPIGTGATKGLVITAAGDVNGDKLFDMYRLDPLTGKVTLKHARRDGALRAQTLAQPADLTDYDLIAGGFSFDGDSLPDLLAYDKQRGNLYLYFGAKGTGLSGSRRWLGNVGAGADRIAMVPKFRNGLPVVFVSRGYDVTLVPGTGTGRITTERLVMPAPLRGLNRWVGAGDWNGDGIGDAIAVGNDGRLILSYGSGTGRFSSVKVLPDAWGSKTDIVLGGKSPQRGLYATYGKNGSLSWHPRVHGAPAVTRGPSTDIGLRSGELAIAAGDWNGDLREDVMVRTLEGGLRMHAGLGSGRFSTAGVSVGSEVRSDWSVFRQIVGAGGWTGDGTPGLLALTNAGDEVVLYRGDGKGGFVYPGVTVHADSSIPLEFVGVAGQFQERGPLDIFARKRADDGLNYFNGAGAGGFHDYTPVPVRPGFAPVAAVVGAYDMDGDWFPDTLVVTKDGGVDLYAGRRNGTVGSVRRLGTLPQGIESAA